MKILYINNFLKGHNVKPLTGGRNKMAFLLMQYFAGVKTYKPEKGLAGYESHEVFIFPWGERVMEVLNFSLGDGLVATVLPTVPPFSFRRLIKAIPRLIAGRGLSLRPYKRVWEWAKSVVFDQGAALSLAIEKIKPDIVHSHLTASDLPFVYRKLGIKRPFILTHHAPGEGSGLELYDYVIFPSEFQRREILRKYPSLAGKSKTIYNYLDNGFCACPGEGKDIVFIGNLGNNRKGLDIVLKAYTQDPFLNRWKFVVIGDGTMRAEYENFAKEKELNIHFVGRLSAAGNAETMQKAALFVMPSRAEGFAIVYQEAICSGLPVIGYPPNVSELSEILKMPVGLPFDASRDSPKKLAELIKTMMTPESGFGLEIRQEIARRARKIFSLEGFGSEHVNLYQAVRAEVLRKEHLSTVLIQD